MSIYKCLLIFNRYIERLREQGAHYKDKVVGNSAVLSNIQAKINDHLNQQQYDKKIKDAYDSAHRAVASNVETFRGKADTIIKQVRQNPRQYAVDTGRQIMGYAQDQGEKAGEVLQEAGKKSVDTLQEAGRQSVDKIQQVHADTRDLVNDMRDNPDKYVEKAKQKYRETLDTLEDQANKLGDQANRAVDSMKDTAAMLNRKAARGLKTIERRIDRARS